MDEIVVIVGIKSENMNTVGRLSSFEMFLVEHQ